MGGLSLINVARDGAMWWAVVKTTYRREYAAASPRNTRYNPLVIRAENNPALTLCLLQFHWDSSVRRRNSLLHFSCGIPQFIGWTSTEPLKVQWSLCAPPV